jgi:hypothetical protein
VGCSASASCCKLQVETYSAAALEEIAVTVVLALGKFLKQTRNQQHTLAHINNWSHNTNPLKPENNQP